MLVGVNYDEVPPVPIPNTEVKLISADDTWLETARENRSSPTLISGKGVGRWFTIPLAGRIILNSSAGRACGC